MKFQKGHERSNTGAIVMHRWEISVSVESDDPEFTPWAYHSFDMELPSNTKPETIATKTRLAIGMSGYTQTNDYLEILKGDKL